MEKLNKQVEEAIREAKIALELEPVNPVMMRRLGSVYYYARQYDLALKELNKCLEIDPGQRSTYSWVFLAIIKMQCMMML